MKKFKSEIVEKIFEYDDYRTFLKDYFDEQKENRRVFTFRYFAEKAGFSAHSFCMRVIEGTRNLGSTSIPKMCHAMDLKGKQAKYFEILVHQNQTKDVAKKQVLIQELDSIRLSTKLFRGANNKLHSLFSKWYYPVVRELAVTKQWHGQFDLLASMVIPSITPGEAKEAVETMIEAGFLKVSKSGLYEMKDDFVSGEKVNIITKKKYRRDLLAHGVAAADAFGPDERLTTASTLMLSKKAYEKITNIYNEAIDDILSVAATDDDDADRVYHVTMNMFPATKSIKDTEGKFR